jgi:hypothetical protein
MGLGDGDCMIYIVLQLLCSPRVFIFLLESLSFSSSMVQVVCFFFPIESFFWRVSDQWICMYAFFVLFQKDITERRALSLHFSFLSTPDRTSHHF